MYKANMSIDVATQTVGADQEKITSASDALPCSWHANETRLETVRWYAVQTRVHQERMVKDRLVGQGGSS